ncbi:hypothetical protein ACJJJB_21135 [Microbulbifer sp. ANSA001]|uniref:hypothetical protein n=1 Tax=Microbulbifer sp. ANSA001 TaxID=3243358 RepID=UPI004042F23B
MGGGGDGSPASISAHLANVKIESVGYGTFDGDGIRIDERGEGSIYTTVIDSFFSRIGADGIELDEGDKGDVTAQIIRSRFVDNGNYCDPTVLKNYIHKQPSDEEMAKVMGESGPVLGKLKEAPDDRCIERHLSKTDGAKAKIVAETVIDLDDGIDIDEAADGDIHVSITDSEVLDNKDEGIDLDESGKGDAVISIIHTKKMTTPMMVLGLGKRGKEI